MLQLIESMSTCYSRMRLRNISLALMSTLAELTGILESSSALAVAVMFGGALGIDVELGSDLVEVSREV